VFSPIDVERPDLVRHPTFAQVKMLEVVLEPGETVFLPLGWWHQVSSLDVSLSFSFSNLTVPNEFSYQNPSITNW
jgi:ribosomal protein L16 Arg81 hydroxylase